MTAELVSAARRALLLADERLLLECEAAFFIAGGPGGQHRNVTASGVRLLHRPTGIAVSATERRSQARNRAEAMRRLREALEKLAHPPPPRRKTRVPPSVKRRRLEEKRRISKKKAERGGGW